MKGLKDFAATEREAFEEAGLVGRTTKKRFGSYVYWKRRPGHFALVKVDVYPMRVTKQRNRWPEKGSDVPDGCRLRMRR